MLRAQASPVVPSLACAPVDDLLGFASGGVLTLDRGSTDAQAVRRLSSALTDA